MSSMWVPSVSARVSRRAEPRATRLDIDVFSMTYLLHPDGRSGDDRSGLAARIFKLYLKYTSRGLAHHLLKRRSNKDAAAVILIEGDRQCSQLPVGSQAFYFE